MKQTDACQRREGLGTWKEQGEGIKQIYIHDTHRHSVIARGKGRWGVGGGEQSEGVKWGRKKTLLGAMWAPSRVQMMMFWIVHLQPVWSGEQIPPL